MKSLASRLMILGGLGIAGGVVAQSLEPPLPPPPPPPASVQPEPPPGPLPPGMPGRPDRPMRPDGMGGMGDVRVLPDRFSANAPLGSFAMISYMGIQSHREELGLSEAQQKRLAEIWQGAATDREKRSTEMRALQDSIQTMVSSDTLNMARIEASVRALEKLRGDDMLADIRINDALRKVLTAEQRSKLSTLPRRFPGLGPGGPGMPAGAGSRWGTPPVPPVPPIPPVAPGSPTPPPPPPGPPAPGM